ncbi:N-acetylmuramoyl-L-alanine amidase [bacterium]|nr:N-acetylmuramoyl-L-alanine amidase [bacterium]
MDIAEQTNVHEPWHYHADGPSSTYTYSSPPPSSICTSPPTGYQTWVVCTLNPPQMTFSFHNTDYVVTVNYYYIVFTGAYPPSPSNPMYRRVDGSISITVHFENLIVNAQPEYLINNPGGDNHNTAITFQLASAQKKYCSATISIYSSAGQLVKQETLNNLLCPGTYTYQWDGKITQGTPPVSKVAPSGIYPYDIEVVGASPYDTDSRCSKNLKITQTNVEIIGYDEATGLSTLRVSYVLEDTGGREAKSAKIRIFDPDLICVADSTDGVVTNLPGTANPLWNTKDLNINFNKWGTWIALVSAVDNYADIYKNHQPKRALDRNHYFIIRVAGVMIDPGHGGSDSGAVGASGTLEKTVNLTQSQKLQNALQGHLCFDGFGHSNVVQPTIVYLVNLTRDSDVNLSIKKRAEITAKKYEEYIKQVDNWRKRGVKTIALGFVFISVHHDSAGSDVKHTLVMHIGDSGGFANKILARVCQIPTQQQRIYEVRATTERMGMIKTLRNSPLTRYIPAVLIEVTNLKNSYDEGLAKGNEDFPSKFAITTHLGVDDYLLP